MNDFFLPLVKEVNEMFEEKIIFEHSNKFFQFVPIITHILADLPARAMLQNTTQFNGYFGCAYCKMKGATVNGESVVRFGFSENIEERSHSDTLHTVVRAHRTKKRIEGIKGVSFQAALNHFDVIWCNQLDVMHCIFLGSFSSF